VSCLQLNEVGDSYQLYIPECELCYSDAPQTFTAFQQGLADLLPNNKRFIHALQTVANIRDLLRHPVNWTVDKELHFLTSFIAMGSRIKLPKLDTLVKVLKVLFTH
jgi:hypothetical protein